VKFGTMTKPGCSPGCLVGPSANTELALSLGDQPSKAFRLANAWRAERVSECTAG